MGENFQAAGFGSIQEMVDAMVVSEDDQRAMVAFMQSMKLIDTLRSRDWRGFARRYNGPNFAANNYDGLLAHFFQRYSDGALPDLTIRGVQICLTYKGFKLGSIGGLMGGATRVAIAAFQSSRNLPATGQIDDRTV